MSEEAPQSENREPSPVFKEKYAIQMGIIQRLLGNRPRSMEERNKIVDELWTQPKNSNEFATIFDRRVAKEPNFLRRCREETEAVIYEVMKELGLTELPPAA
jgi:hypothetical protein